MLTAVTTSGSRVSAPQTAISPAPNFFRRSIRPLLSAPIIRFPAEKSRPPPWKERQKSRGPRKGKARGFSKAQSVVHLSA